MDQNSSLGDVNTVRQGATNTTDTVVSTPRSLAIEDINSRVLGAYGLAADLIKTQVGALAGRLREAPADSNITDLIQDVVASIGKLELASRGCTGTEEEHLQCLRHPSEASALKDHEELLATSHQLKTFMSQRSDDCAVKSQKDLREQIDMEVQTKIDSIKAQDEAPLTALAFTNKCFPVSIGVAKRTEDGPRSFSWAIPAFVLSEGSAQTLQDICKREDWTEWDGWTTVCRANLQGNVALL